MTLTPEEAHGLGIAGATLLELAIRPRAVGRFPG